MDLETRTVLIVGAAGGLGQALRERYAAAGWKVESLTRDDADLSDPDAVDRLAASLEARFPKVDLTLFSAGIVESGYVRDLEASSLSRCLEVNFLSPLRLFLALWRRARPCRDFVFVHSGAGELLIPGLAPYAISKRAMRDLLTFVKLETAGDGEAPRLLEVWPGGIRTRINERARVHGSFRPLEQKGAREPGEVADRIFRAHERGARKLVLSPLPNWLGAIQAVCPCLVGWMIRNHPALRKR